MSSRESPIVPTVGRVVLVRGSAVKHSDPNREYPALVTRVWSNNCINAQAFNDTVGGEVLSSVPYLDDVQEQVGAAWRWMPFQMQGASKQEVAAEKISDVTAPTGPNWEVLDRIKAEVVELDVRLTKLTDFIQTPAFKHLASHRARVLLCKQEDAMRSYSEILHERIHLLEATS